jgi:HK97 family phage major capsid protein
MTSIQALRERRAALAKDTRNMLDQNPGATWNAEHQKKYDENMDEIGRIEAEIERHQKVIELDADRQIKDMARDLSRNSEGTDERSVLAAWARGGFEALSADQRQAYRIANTMSTTTGSEGGYTVQTDVAKQLQDALKAFGGVRSVADIFTTDQGNPMNYPTSDGTSEAGELIAENTTATAADPTFGTVALNVYKFSSKIVAVPFELLQDSSIDIEAFVRGRLATRIARAMNTYFTTGTGSSQPRGVVTAAGSGKVGTTGQTTTVIYDDLIDLQHSVDPAYRALGCSFMMADSSLKVIRKLKDSQNRPIFVPGYETGRPGGEPDTLLGSPIVINQDMAAMAANAKSILFGHFGAYKIRDVMQYTLFRFTDSAYAKLGQVGFLAWARSGGNFVDVGNSLKYYQNSAT